MLNQSIVRKKMKNINWFMVRQIIGHGIDLARIFPIIFKHQDTSKIIAGISSHLLEAPQTIWIYLLVNAFQLKRILSSLIPGWISELSLKYIGVFRLDLAIQSILG